MKKWLTMLLTLALALTAVLPALAEGTAAMMTGAWQATDDAAIPQDVADAFTKAMTGWTGSELTPVALLATQVVAGENVCLLCHLTLVTPEAESGYALVYLSIGLDGTAKVMSVVDLDVAALLPADAYGSAQ